MFGGLRGALSDVLELPDLVQRRSKKHSEDHGTVVKTAPTSTLDKNRRNQQVGDLLAWTLLSSSCIPTFVPLFMCCVGDPLVGEVTRIIYTWHFSHQSVAAPDAWLH